MAKSLFKKRAFWYYIFIAFLVIGAVFLVRNVQNVQESRQRAAIDIVTTYWGSVIDSSNPNRYFRASIDVCLGFSGTIQYTTLPGLNVSGTQVNECDNSNKFPVFMKRDVAPQNSFTLSGFTSDSAPSAYGCDRWEVKRFNTQLQEFELYSSGNGCTVTGQFPAIMPGGKYANNYQINYYIVHRDSTTTYWGHVIDRNDSNKYFQAKNRVCNPENLRITYVTASGLKAGSFLVDQCDNSSLPMFFSGPVSQRNNFSLSSLPAGQVCDRWQAHRFKFMDSGGVIPELYREGLGCSPTGSFPVIAAHEGYVNNYRFTYFLKRQPPTPSLTPTLTPTNTPRPTRTPTPSVTPISTLTPTSTPRPTRTPTPNPSSTPIPTSTGTPTNTPVPGDTSLSLTLFLHGIGRGGDNVNPQSIGNNNPQHPERSVNLEIFNTEGQSLGVKSGTVTYDSVDGNFKGEISIGSISTGPYRVRAVMQYYLGRLYTGIVNITSGQTNTLPAEYLITGDSNEDNNLSILDYNIILDCYSGLSQPRNCADENKKLSADLTDDGQVNQFDYNLFLREMSVQSGQ